MQRDQRATLLEYQEQLADYRQRKATISERYLVADDTNNTADLERCIGDLRDLKRAITNTILAAEDLKQTGALYGEGLRNLNLGLSTLAGECDTSIVAGEQKIASLPSVDSSASSSASTSDDDDEDDEFVSAQDDTRLTPNPAPAPAPKAAPDDIAGFFASRSQRNALQYIRDNMSRYDTFTNYIHEKVTREMSAMAPNMADIQRWLNSSHALQKQLQKYADAMQAAYDYQIDPVAGREKKYFAVWGGDIDKNDLDNLNHALAKLTRTIAELQHLRNTLQTTNRQYISSGDSYNTAFNTEGVEMLVGTDTQPLQNVIEAKLRGFQAHYQGSSTADIDITVGHKSATSSYMPGSGTVTNFITHEVPYRTQSNPADPNSAMVTKYSGVAVFEESNGRYSKQTIHLNKDHIESLGEESPEIRKLAFELIHNARVGCSEGPINLTNLNNWPGNLRNAVAAEILHRGYDHTLPKDYVDQLKQAGYVDRLSAQYASTNKLSDAGAAQINKLAEETKVSPPFRSKL